MLLRVAVSKPTKDKRIQRIKKTYSCCLLSYFLFYCYKRSKSYCVVAIVVVNVIIVVVASAAAVVAAAAFVLAAAAAVMIATDGFLVFSLELWKLRTASSPWPFRGRDGTCA